MGRDGEKCIWNPTSDKIKHAPQLRGNDCFMMERTEAPNILPWLQEHSAAVMVVVAVIFVIGTLAMIYMNYKSLEAAKAQLIESKRQHDEKNRLQYMPFLSVSFMEQNDQMIRVKNVGNASAVNIRYKESCLDPLMQGDEITIPFHAGDGGADESDDGLVMVWSYSDILGNTYEQKVTCTEGEVRQCEAACPRLVTRAG